MADETRGNAKVEEVLEGVDPSRRKFIRGLIAGSAYIAPVVSSFSLSALTAEPAMAQGSNLS